MRVDIHQSKKRTCPEKALLYLTVMPELLELGTQTNDSADFNKKLEDYKLEATQENNGSLGSIPMKQIG